MRKHRKKSVLNVHPTRRPLSLEYLEDRRMLSAAADIVFLLDKSGSVAADPDVLVWLKDEIFSSTTGVAKQLVDPGKRDSDVRYGLIGFGDSNSPSGGFAHSYIVNSSAADPFFGTAAQLDVVLENLASSNPSTFGVHGEDGWDAFEHVVSEYRFRPGAVPVVVLLQNVEGRNYFNTTLTRDGVLAALKSKNVVVNTMTYGGDSGNGELFDLSPYGGNSDVRILGVEADQNDPQGIDGRHNYAGLNTITGVEVATVGATTSQAMQVSYNGSNTGATGMVASGKSVQFAIGGSGGLGPSAFGYRATSVDFNTSIVDTTTGFTVHSNLANSITLPSTLSYYGTNYSQIWVSEDGSVRFGSANDPGGSNVDLSKNLDAPSVPIIAALWDDLTAGTSGQIVTKIGNYDGVGGNNDLAIEWRNFRYATSSSTVNDSITFQLVINSNGQIRVNYIDLEDSGVLGARFSGGISSTVGLWKGTSDNVSLPTGKFVPGLHSYFGSTNDAELTPAESNDRYVRLAWDTGGAAWDLGIVDGVGDTGSLTTARAALKDAFFDSLGAQINRQAAAGKVYHGDVPILEVNASSVAVGSYVDGYGKPYAPSSVAILNTTESYNNLSNTINFSANGAYVHNSLPRNVDPRLFQTSLTTPSNATSMVWNFNDDTMAGGIANGTYIVELLFADLTLQTFNLTTGQTAAANRTFDVYLEGKQVLDDYSIYKDHAKATGGAIHPQTGALHNNQLGGTADSGTIFRGTVKRFEVDVTDGNGLQIKFEDADGKALVNAIRILKADRPLAVTEVVLRNSSWTKNPFHFSDMVRKGEQLRPIATQGINQLQIRFSEDIRKRSADGLSLTPIASTAAEGNQLLTLMRTYRDPNAPTITDIVSATGFTYDSNTFTATWTFSSLNDGKYAIHLKTGINGQVGIADVNGNALDADWTNDPGSMTVGGQVRPTWDDFQDDPKRQFIIGDGTAGSANNEFRLHFALLAGDYDGDGLVEHSNEAVLGDGNGDGNVNSSDINIGTNGKRLALQKILGVDFNDDEIVDRQDLLIWQTSWGIDDDGDATGDNETDGLDFMRWLTAFSNKSAWYINPTSIAAALVGDAAPHVINVIVSGSMSAHAPFSFDTVDGSGTQLNTVPVGKADTISIVFSENVNVSAETLFVVGLRTANLPMLAEFAYDPLTFTATWRFQGWVAGDNYLLYLSDSVTDTEGNFLDGEWTNPASTTTTNSLVSEFPSGDGDPGGAFAFVMTLLTGDMNLDGTVDNTDYDLYVASLMQGGGTLFIHGDFNGSGTVSSMDTGLFVANWLTDLRELFILADLNSDGQVNDADLNVIYSNYGSTTADWEHGDLNGDQIVDELDIDLAFAQFGPWGLDMVG
jgi:hypothetical protein